MVAYAFRDRPLHALIAIAAGLLILETALMSLVPITILSAQAGMPNATSAVDALAGINQFIGIPSDRYLAADIALHRGPYLALLSQRFVIESNGLLNSLILLGPETLAYMLLGMAALRSGLLSGEWSSSRSWRWATVSFMITIPVYAVLATYMVKNDFSILSVSLSVLVLPIPIRPVMIVGWTCLIVLIARRRTWLTLRLAAAGRMAFTNYLTTSFVMTFIFYGQGMALYGVFSRATLYWFVAAMWLAMLAWSKPWLDRFQYGPFEWLWRSLARRERQQFRRTF